MLWSLWGLLSAVCVCVLVRLRLEYGRVSSALEERTARVATLTADVASLQEQLAASATSLADKVEELDRAGAEVCIRGPLRCPFLRAALCLWQCTQF